MQQISFLPYFRILTWLCVPLNINSVQWRRFHRLFRHSMPDFYGSCKPCKCCRHFFSFDDSIRLYVSLDVNWSYLQLVHRLRCRRFTLRNVGVFAVWKTSRAFLLARSVFLAVFLSRNPPLSPSRNDTLAPFVPSSPRPHNTHALFHPFFNPTEFLQMDEQGNQ